MQETPAALAAFERYWQMGPQRTIAKLAEQDCRSGLSKSAVTTRERQLFEWSSQHGWQARLKERIEQDAAEFRAEMKERAAAFRKRVIGAIEVDASRYLNKLQDSGKELLADDAADLERMVKLYMQLAEQPLGERVEITGRDGGPVQVVPVFGPDDHMNNLNDDSTSDEEDDEASEAEERIDADE
jgi:hypothetical protein